MIEILLACSPPLDGSEFTCPPPDFFRERKVVPVRKPEKDERPKNPFDKVILLEWRYEL
tara:strand:+ start:174 stop:350 length:177 start_codon:yes stop_codon:yes gene_type:complete